MFENFPLGANNDPAAPYNKKDPEMIPFEAEDHGTCSSCGEEDLTLDKNGNCETCYEAYVPKYYDDED